MTLTTRKYFNMKHFNISVLSTLIITLMLTGCFSSKTSLSIMRMDRPEVSGEVYTLRAQAGHSLANKDITLTGRFFGTREARRNIDDGNPASELTPEVEEGGDFTPLFAGLGITVIPKLELQLTGLDSERKIKLKYQFAGQNSEQAEKGNLSQAISFSYSYQQQEEFEEYESNQTILIDEIEQTSYRNTSIDWQQKNHVLDVAWIVGYRFAKKHMFYGGPFYIRGSLSGYQSVFDQQSFSPDYSDAITTEEQISLDSAGSAKGLNLAYEYSFNFGMFFTAEISMAKVTWENSSATSEGFSFLVGYRF